MPDFSFLLLHAEDHAASAIFYNELLEIPIIEQKPDFAMLPLRDGVMLGLWLKETVEPKSTANPARVKSHLPLPTARPSRLCMPTGRGAV